MKSYNIVLWVEGLTIPDLEELHGFAKSYNTGNLSILLKPYMKFIKEYEQLKDHQQ